MNKTKIVYSVTMLILLLTLGLSTAFAQQLPLWHLGNLEGHTGPVLSLQFSPDRSILASGSEDSTVRLWNAATGAHLATLRGHTWNVTSLAFSADSTTLASASHTEVFVWDVATRQRKAMFEEHTGKVTGIALSANGNILASGSTDGTVQVWDIVTGQRKATFEGHSGEVHVTLTNDGNTCASTKQELVLLWDISSGQRNATLNTEAGSNKSLAFSPNGRTLATNRYVGSGFYGLQLWDVPSGKHKTIIRRIYNTQFTSLAFSADGRTIIGALDNSTVFVQDVTSGQLKASFVRPNGVWSIAYGTERGTLASANADYTVAIYDVASGQRNATLNTETADVGGGINKSLAFSPNGRTLATNRYVGSGYFGLQLWDVPSGKHKTAIRRIYNTQFTHLAFSADGRTIIGALTNNTVFVQDVPSRQVKSEFTLDKHTDGVRSIAVSPDFGTLASASEDWTVRLWDTATGTHKAVFEGHTDWVNSVAFSPDGDTLISGSSDGTVIEWDAATGHNRATLEGHTGAVEDIVFSPDGSLFASVSQDGIQLRNATTVQHEATFTVPTENLTRAAFSSDGRLLAGGTQHGWVYVWEIATGQLKTTISHGHAIADIAFSSNGRTVAIAGGSNVSVWELTPSRWALTSPASGGVDTTPMEEDPGTGVTPPTGTTPEGPVVDMTPSTDTTVSPASVSIQSPAVGEKLRLNINIAGGENIVGYELTVQFDPTAFSKASILPPHADIGSYLPGSTVAVQKNTENSVTYSVVSLTDSENRALGEAGDGAGILAVLSLEVIAVKESTLILKTVLSDSGGNLSYPRVESVRVVEPSVTESFDVDINNDGVVDIQDFNWVVQSLGKTGPELADVNGDLIVNIADLVLVAAAIGETAGAPSIYTRTFDLFTAEDVAQWLTEAKQFVKTDPAYRRGILVLKQLLTLLTPKKTALLPNYPNPFNPETWIPYQLSKPADVTLTIYNMRGVVVRELKLGHQAAGIYRSRSRAAYWDGKNEVGESVASGVYFYVLKAGDFSATRKMLIRK